MTQQEALAILESGQSALVTGAAGTGKTYVLNQFIKRARKDGKTVAVTATTGLAATHLGGNTIHAWSGIGVRDSLDGIFFSKLSKSRTELIEKADILVIDEISMLHDFRLDMIEEVARRIRGGDRPFGGLQVVLCGDFFQLPPINRGDSRQGGFVTRSKIWETGYFAVCYLHTQYRQSEDADYGAILNGIREGRLTRSQLSALQARGDAVVDPFTPRTRLLTINVDVDTINHRHLDALDTQEQSYEMQTSGRKQYVESLLKSCLAPQVLRLKKDAMVMCIKNSQDKKYANGSLGVVTAFEQGTQYPIVRLTNGREIVVRPETWELVDGDKRRATATQLPLRLAWAITVHKSQGMTLDAAQIDLSKAFVEGMGYVALSRVRSLKHLTLDGMNGMALRTSQEARLIDALLQDQARQTLNKHEDTIARWLEDENKPKEDSFEGQNSPKTAWSEKLAAMRKDFPNAYKPWSEQDDVRLVKLASAGNGVATLSKLLGRHPGSIKIRLNKHFGDTLVAE